MIDHYAILGLTSEATLEEIEKAYRKKAVECHPDRNPDDPQAVENLKAINAAYDFLSNPANRKVRPTQPEPKPFKDVFGGNAYRGRNVQARVEIDLYEVATGVKKDVEIEVREYCRKCDGSGLDEFQTCPVCNGKGHKEMMQHPFSLKVGCTVCRGSGKISRSKCSDCVGTGFTPFKRKTVAVQIPPGIENGMQIKVEGAGEGGVHARSGDLIVFVIVKEHPILRREKEDVIVTVPVSFTDVVLGCELELETIWKEMVKVQVPAGTQSGDKIFLKKKGLPNYRKHGHVGDFVVHVKVETPSAMSEEYRDVLKRLAEFERREITPKRKAWSERNKNSGNQDQTQ